MAVSEKTLALVGTPFTTLKCYDLVRAVIDIELGVKLPVDLYDALGMFRTVRDLQALDVVAFRTHPLFVSHYGVMIDNDRFIHSLETTGVALSSISEDDWQKRVACSLDGRVGYLRLR